MKALSENARGALMMAIAMAAFTCNDACMKTLGQTLSLSQAVFLRGIGTTLGLVALAVAFGQFRPRQSRRDYLLIAIRSGAEVAAAYTFLTALFKMQLANITAIMQALPLVLTLVGALFLKERIGWRRLTASIVGLVGVLMIVQPGTDSFNIYSVYALATVGLVVIRDIAARKMSSDVPSIFAAACAACAVMIYGGVGMFFEDWQPVDTKTGLLLGGAMFFVFIGYLLSVICMRIGEISFIAPFRYIGLVVGVVLGYLVFNTLPNTLALAGCVVVVGSGLFIFNRQRQIAEAEQT